MVVDEEEHSANHKSRNYMPFMEKYELFTSSTILLLAVMNMVIAGLSQRIPTTLEGPFKPTTRSFDPSLRRGSDDLPMNHPRLRKNVTSNFPEQIALALSTPTSMWISWVTGTMIFVTSVLAFLVLLFEFVRWVLL